jgi:hypothetical protein
MAATSNAERAQIGRINRRLAKEGQTLRKIRDDSRWFAQYGPFQIVDDRTTAMLAYGITDLDELETELRNTPSVTA